MFQIKKGLALPTKKAGRSGESKYLTTEMKAAYNAMEQGDSIEVPVSGFELEPKKVSSWLAYYANKKFISDSGAQKKFRTAVSNDGAHVIVQCVSVDTSFSNAEIFGNARVYGDAEISGNARGFIGGLK